MLLAPNRRWLLERVFFIVLLDHYFSWAVYWASGKSAQLRVRKDNSASLAVYQQNGVGTINNRPSTDKLHHFVQKNVTCDTWHMTCDTWHVIHDMWLMTRDMWHVWGVNILSKFQLPSSYCLWFMIIGRSGGKGSPTELNNDKAVHRTAPGTPGLVKTSQDLFFLWGARSYCSNMSTKVARLNGLYFCLLTLLRVSTCAVC